MADVMNEFPVGSRVKSTLLSGIVPRKYGVVEEYDPDDITPYHWLVRWADGMNDWMDEDGIVMQDLIHAVNQS